MENTEMDKTREEQKQIKISILDKTDIHDKAKKLRDLRIKKL